MTPVSIAMIYYSTDADSRNRTGIAAVVFNTDKNEYRVAVSDGIGMSSFSGMSITGEDERIPEDWVTGGGPIRDEPVKVTKGEAIPIAACEMGPMEYSTFHDPWELEEDYKYGDVETDFAIVVKLRFD